MLKKRKNGPFYLKILSSKNTFRFGSCAAIAICSAFDCTEQTFRIVCHLLKIKEEFGLSFFECKKVINALNLGREVKYVPNKAVVNYPQMAYLLNKGSYIVMFKEHLSFIEDGV